MTRWTSSVTLVACLACGTARPAAAQSDSAAVASVVERYHRALAQGDSVAALALLAPERRDSGGGGHRRCRYGEHRQSLFFAFVYHTLGVPVAAGVLYPAFGQLPSPILAAAAMTFSSVSVITNPLRLRHAAL